MSASTALITDMTTVSGGTFSATSIANANAAAGPINDQNGNCRLVLMKLQEAKILLAQVKASVDGGDALLTTINNVLSSLA
jgi:hypothetical protein